MASNFSNWQESEQKSRGELIQGILKSLEKARATFEKRTHLAEYVASHLAKVQDKPCDSSTLLRNPHYRLLLMTFMGGGESVDAAASEEPAPGPVHQAALLSAELKALNLGKQLARLQAKEKSTAPSDDKSVSQGRQLHGYAGQADFVLTCQALLAVLKHYEGLLFADSEARRIVDRTSRPHSVVVDEAHAKPFFEWLHRNRNVGGVHD